ncbi:hypothetical protein GE061_009506 [Apolygus lucorum]|uniref:Uncharacterized protein n=1 Tax=Apolygus lucorum TaxID=248454 RepID=A0A8S9Y0Q7_APOLU|nr:hypothetical protein GE061_009506 [Apolygus lucorum]
MWVYRAFTKQAKFVTPSKIDLWSNQWLQLKQQSANMAANICKEFQEFGASIVSSLHDNVLSNHRYSLTC